MMARQNFYLSLILTFVFSFSAKADDVTQLLSIVFKSTNEIWTSEFSKVGAIYKEPGMVFYDGMVSTGCGMGEKSHGPFYCPLDEKLYIDPSFMDALANKLGAPGDMAQAYVIAHEVGHHVQNKMGLIKKLEELKQGQPEILQNQMQVRLELNADCLAGVWARIANRKRKFIEPGDIGEVLNAAAKIGDDHLQVTHMGFPKVRPELFTHGSGNDRKRWFTRGVLSGDLNVCMKVFQSVD